MQNRCKNLMNVTILVLLTGLLFAQQEPTTSSRDHQLSQLGSMVFIPPIHGDSQHIISLARLSDRSRIVFELVDRVLTAIIQQGEVPTGVITGPFRLPTTQALLQYRRFFSSVQEKRFLVLEFIDLPNRNQRAALSVILIGEPNWIEIELYLDQTETDTWTIINGNVFLREDRLRL
jgi:hypothetical protein